VKTRAVEKPIITDEPDELSAELRELVYSRPDMLRILDVHADTLDRWDRRGCAPPKVVLPGRQIVYFKDAFVKWMRDRQQQPKRVRQRGR